MIHLFALMLVALAAPALTAQQSSPLWPPGVQVDSAVGVRENPRLAWDPSSVPPRCLWLGRNHVDGTPEPPYYLWTAAAELYQNGRLQFDTYPNQLYGLDALRRNLGGGSEIRVGAWHQEWQDDLDHYQFFTEATARLHVRRAGLFRVIWIEPGLDERGAPTNMVTLEPIRWIRGDPGLSGPYFLQFPATRVRVGPWTVIDAGAEQGEREEAFAPGARVSHRFRPTLGHGDRVIVLESLPAAAPPRILTTRGYGQWNIIVFDRDGSSAQGKFDFLPVQVNKSSTPGTVLEDLERALGAP